MGYQGIDINNTMLNTDYNAKLQSISTVNLISQQLTTDNNQREVASRSAFDSVSSNIDFDLATSYNLLIEQLLQNALIGDLQAMQQTLQDMMSLLGNASKQELIDAFGLVDQSEDLQMRGTFTLYGTIIVTENLLKALLGAGVGVIIGTITGLIVAALGVTGLGAFLIPAVIGFVADVIFSAIIDGTVRGDLPIYVNYT